MKPLPLIPLPQMPLNKVPRTRRLRIPPILHRILHIRNLRLELPVQQLRRVQQRKTQIPRFHPGRHRPPLQPHRAGEDPCVRLAGRYELRSGERGHIDDEVEVWDVARGVRDSVGEDYAAFGVGVVDLDGFSGVAGEYVVVADGVGSDGVSARQRMRTMRVWGGDSLTAVEKAPSIAADPPISCFIPGIPILGLSDSPPVS